MEQLVEWELTGEANIWRNPASVPFCKSQIPHYFTWDRTRAIMVGVFGSLMGIV
jgi:hypothetical protein